MLIFFFWFADFRLMRQACILMLFNQQETYTTIDIANATKLPMDELKKYLNTLALSK